MYINVYMRGDFQESGACESTALGSEKAESSTPETHTWLLLHGEVCQRRPGLVALASWGLGGVTQEPNPKPYTLDPEP